MCASVCVEMEFDFPGKTGLCVPGFMTRAAGPHGLRLVDVLAGEAPGCRGRGEASQEVTENGVFVADPGVLKGAEQTVG